MKGKLLSGIMFFVLLLPIGVWGDDHGMKDDDEPKSGFSANIMLGPVWQGLKVSQDEVGEDNELINSYDQRTDSESSIKPAFIANLSYTFDKTGTIIFLEKQPEEIISAIAGIEQPLGEIGSISLSLGYTQIEVWEDPYLLNVYRKETNSSDISINLGYKNILGTRAQAEYSYHMIDVEDDLIAEIEPDLSRDGNIHSLTLGYALTLNESNSFMPELKYSKGIFDGKSNRYDSYELGLKHIYMRQPYSLATSIMYGTAEYDRDHPVFNKKREEDRYSASMFFRLMEPFGFKNVSYNIIASYKKTDANITFFDSREIISGMGIGYSF